MNINSKTINRGGQTYESPSVKTLEILSEGVLCSSFDRADAGYDYDNDLGEI